MSPTSSSPSESLRSPEPNFTRGIINPNYPGFQHLAHTLSEHFLDHNFEHLSDSEISEDFDTSTTNLNTEFFNNNNNFDETIINRGSVETNPFIIMMAEQSDNNFNDEEKLVNTPDILIKNVGENFEENITKPVLDDSKPDLLKNINVDQITTENDLTKMDDQNGKIQLVITECKTNENQITPNDYSSLQSITPLDIVGDFEREIEQEIGLIVSGYKMENLQEISKESNIVQKYDKDFIEREIIEGSKIGTLNKVRHIFIVFTR